MQSARIESLLIIRAQDSASVALGKARDSIEDVGTATATASKRGRAASDDLRESFDHVGSAAEKAARAAAKAEKDAAKAASKVVAEAARRERESGSEFKVIGEKSGDIESTLKGLSDFSGASGAAVSKVGDAFGAVEAITRLLPGQLGLAATAIGGIALGAQMLGKHLAEADAKVRLLGDAATTKLKDQLDLSVDGAIALSQALGDLKDRSLVPTNALLRQVADNAAAMGKDGGQAATEFVRALEGGPQAIQAWQQEFGKLEGQIADKAALASRLGLNTQLLGLSKAQTAEEQTQAQVQATLSRLQLRRIELAKAESDRDRAAAQAQLGDRSLLAEIQRVSLANQAKALDQTAAGLRRQIDLDTDDLRVVSATAAARQQGADAILVLDARAAALEAEAASSRDKATRATLLGEAVTARRLAATKALNAFDAAHLGTLDAKLQVERLTLVAKVAQTNAAANAAADADLAARRQASQRASGEAAARKAAAVDAELRLQRAQADADGERSLQERLALIEAETAKELAGLDRRKLGRQAFAAQSAAIELERQARVAQAEREVAALVARAESDNQALLVAGQQRSTAIVVQLADVRAKNAVSAAEREAASLEAAGDAEGATLMRRVAAQRAYAAEVVRINREMEAAKNGLTPGSEDEKNQDAIRSALLAEAGKQLADKEQSERDKEMERFRLQAAAAAASFAAPIAKLGDTKTGKVLGSLTNGFTTVVGSWTSLEKSAPGAVAAMGQVAAAGMDNTKSQAWLQAGFEAAASLASFAIGDAAGGAQHAAAAAGYAIVAGTSAPTTSSASSGSPGVAAAPGGIGTSVSGGSAPGQATGGKVENYNFYAPLGTAQAIGKAVGRASKSLDRTGFARSRGA